MSYRFAGTESHTLELDGAFDPGGLAVPSGIALDLVDGRARVSLFAFHVDRIRVTGVPLLAWTYAELLWRVAARRGDELAWWVVACDLAPRGPAFAARRYVRYDVRRNAVELTADRLISRGTHTLAIAIGNLPGPPAPAPSEQRRLLVGRDAGWEVPWGDDPEAGGGTRPITVEEDSLSGVTLGNPASWRGTALWHGGRRHRCGVARRWDRATKGP